MFCLNKGKARKGHTSNTVNKSACENAKKATIWLIVRQKYY
jgi:hypothetical protein